MEADVDLDQHLGALAGRRHRLRPAARDGEVVDDERDVRPLLQRQHAAGVGRRQRVGQADVGDAGVDEHLGLAELGAADAGGAGVDLPGGDHRALVRLGVRAQGHAGGGGGRLHAGDVGGKARLLHEYGRRAQISDVTRAP